jgi:threonine synthase
MYQIVEFTTKKIVSAQGFVFTGEHSPWEILMDIAAIKAKLSLHDFRAIPTTMSKYLPLIPIKKDANFSVLGEQPTPLIQSRQLGKQLGVDLLFKLESRNPTGSFKDRGSFVEVSMAKELGAKAMILASTGNMAASCACYAAISKIPCFVLVPESISLAKLAQVIAFGGHIVEIKGSYNDAAQLALIVAKEMQFYLAGDYAFRVEGQKTAAFEIADQLAFQMPDAIIVPMGCGTNIASYAKGFREYQQLGLIDRIPQLIGVETEGANAIFQSYRARKTTVIPLEKTNTLAGAIAVSNPIDAIKALDAIYMTQGLALEVSDQEMLEAQYALSSEEGLFVEISSAATFAALKKLSCGGERFFNKKVICILTGDGLKDTSLMLKNMPKPPSIYPDKNAFMDFYQKYLESE